MQSTSKQHAPGLKDIYDLHCHVIPGIDDGAADLEASLAMLKIAQEHGTTGIVATPHVIEGDWLPAWDKITAACTELSQQAANADINIALYPGAEVAMHLDILELIKEPGPYCLNGGRYLLVELPATHIPQFADDFFFTLQARGITPVLAHPERHPEISRNPAILLEWIYRGVLIQLNGPSLTGRMGEKAMATAELLLANDMVHVIGSDAHSPRTRTPKLAGVVTRMIELVGAAKTKQLLTINPERIINSQDVDVPVVAKINAPKKQGALARLLSKLWS